MEGSFSSFLGMAPSWLKETAQLRACPRSMLISLGFRFARSKSALSAWLKIHSMGPTSLGTGWTGHCRRSGHWRGALTGPHEESIDLVVGGRAFPFIDSDFRKAMVFSTFDLCVFVVMVRWQMDREPPTCYGTSTPTTNLQPRAVKVGRKAECIMMDPCRSRVEEVEEIHGTLASIVGSAPRRCPDGNGKCPASVGSRWIPCFPGQPPILAPSSKGSTPPCALKLDDSNVFRSEMRAIPLPRMTAAPNLPFASLYAHLTQEPGARSRQVIGGATFSRHRGTVPMGGAGKRLACGFRGGGW